MKTPAKIKASPLTSHIGFWMRLVSNSVSQSFAKKLESKGITVAEWVVLREMYGGDDVTSPSAVAELTGLTRGAVSKLVERLLKKDLVIRSESSEDRRYQDIRLTGVAIKSVPALAELADENDEFFFNVLTKTERKTLTAILKKIADKHGIKKMPIQ